MSHDATERVSPERRLLARGNEAKGFVAVILQQMFVLQLGFGQAIWNGNGTNND